MLNLVLGNTHLDHARHILCGMATDVEHQIPPFNAEESGSLRMTKIQTSFLLRTVDGHFSSETWRYLTQRCGVEAFASAGLGVSEEQNHELLLS